MADRTVHYPRYTPRDRSLRASDRDREAVGEWLRREHVAGRLDTDEFADRYGRCLAAKTYAELDQLVTDLPDEEALKTASSRPGRASAGPWEWGRGGSPWAERPDWRRAAWRAGRGFWRVPMLAWVAAIVALGALSGGHVFWLGLPLFFAFFFFFRPFMWRATWRGSAAGPGQGWRGCGPWACWGRGASPQGGPGSSSLGPTA